MRFLAASLSLLALSSSVAAKAAQPLRHLVLLELFTSEGCSSCPPADDLLRELNGKHLSGGSDVIALSEHVTYWNYLGWHDRYDKPVFDQRQQAYSRRFGKDGVYTPQMVVNGEREMVGSNRSAVQRSLTMLQPQGGLHVSITAATLDRGQVQIGYRTSGKVTGDFDLYMAVVQDAPGAKVTRGENNGATLAHASVARAFMRIAAVHAAGDGQASLPVTMLGIGVGAPPVTLVLFAQTPGLGPILSVDAAPLKEATTQADLR